MATTQVSTEYVLRAIDNLEKHVKYTLPAKNDSYHRREAEYNDKRKWVKWLVSDYEFTWEGMRDYVNAYDYAYDELNKAKSLKELIENSENGEITIDDGEAAMLQSFLNIKTGD